jgi:hypothetical protein
VPDFFDQQGFQYNEETFDDLFVKKFKDILEISTESSEEESNGEEEVPKVESEKVLEEQKQSSSLG